MIFSKVISYLAVMGMLANLVLPRVMLGIWFYPSYFISILLMCILVYKLLKNRGVLKISKSVYLLLFVILSVFLSYSYAVIVLGLNVDRGLLVWEILMFVTFVPYILYFKYINLTEKEINKVVLLFFGVFVLVGISQIFGLEKAVNLYAYEAHRESSLSGFRLNLTGTEPNVGSIIASFFLIFFFIRFVTKSEMIYLFLSLVALFFMLSTQGRTTIIGSSLALLLYYFYISKVRLYKKVLILVPVLISVVFLYQYVDVSYLTTGLETLSEGHNNSVNVRLDNVKHAFDSWLRSPFLGWGSYLEAHGSISNIDSEVALILQRYGLFGLSIIIYIIFHVLNSTKNHRKSTLGGFVFIMMISLCFNMLTNAVFYSKQVFSIVVFLIFIGYYLKSNAKSRE